MIPPLEKIRTRIADNQAELTRLEEESRRVLDGLDPSEKALERAGKALKLAQSRFDQAVIFTPGTQEETHAQEELTKAHDEVERARNRFQAFETANNETSINMRQNRILSLHSEISRDREQAWGIVRTSELETMPPEEFQRVLAVLRRVFVAQGFGTFASFAAGIFGSLAPSEGDQKAMRKELAQSYGLE